MHCGWVQKYKHAKSPGKFKKVKDTWLIFFIKPKSFLTNWLPFGIFSCDIDKFHHRSDRHFFVVHRSSTLGKLVPSSQEGAQHRPLTFLMALMGENSFPQNSHTTTLIIQHYHTQNTQDKQPKNNIHSLISEELLKKSNYIFSDEEYYTR